MTAAMHPEDAAPTALICGTFDVGNYGDLLFPIVAAHRLGRLGWRVLPVSPTMQPSGFADALPALPLAEIVDRTRFDAVLIGGGDIIHGWRADFLREYRIGDLPGWAYTALWFGATAAAALADVPVAWNAPGVPSPFPEQPRRLALQPALAAADYVAVRDPASAQFLGSTTEAEIAVVPDTVAELAQVWPRAVLAPMFRALAARKGIGAEEALLAVHLRPGGTGPAAPEAIAARLADFAGARGLVPLLVSIGPSLGDAATLRRLAAALPLRHVCLDDPASLQDVAAAIAASRLYIGNSMHGYITAASYGVPGVIVARPAFRKFAGITRAVGRDADAVPDWETALDRAAGILGERVEIGAPVFAAIETHWQRLASAIADRDAGRARRARFLRALVAGGVATAGFGWLTQPFVTRAGSGRVP